MSHYQMRTVEEQTVWHTSIPSLSRSHTLHDAHAFCMREETRGGTCTPPQQQQMHSIATGNSYCTEYLRSDGSDTVLIVLGEELVLILIMCLNILED